jgi:hypothetical protein
MRKKQLKMNWSDKVKRTIGSFHKLRHYLQLQKKKMAIFVIIKKRFIAKNPFLIVISKQNLQTVIF